MGRAVGLKIRYITVLSCTLLRAIARATLPLFSNSVLMSRLQLDASQRNYYLLN